MNTLLKTELLSYTPASGTLFNRNADNKSILNNVSFSISKGDVYGVTGESGSGKTTLAKLIAEIIKPTSGKIVKNFASPDKERTNPIQILFQNNDEIINPLRNVKDLLNDCALTIDELENICKLVGIDKKLFMRKGYQLSGGERQRTALARLLLTDPEILILDEPFSAQDPTSQKNLVELFKSINKQLGLTMIVVSHDIVLLKYLCDKTAVMYGGSIVELGKTRHIFSNAKHPYTKLLLNSSGYSLTRKDFGNTVNRNTNIEMCPYYYRCPNKSGQCINDITKIESEELITYCNHPN